VLEENSDLGHQQGHKVGVTHYSSEEAKFQYEGEEKGIYQQYCYNPQEKSTSYGQEACPGPWFMKIFEKQKPSTGAGEVFFSQVKSLISAAAVTTHLLATRTHPGA